MRLGLSAFLQLIVSARVCLLLILPLLASQVPFGIPAGTSGEQSQSAINIPSQAYTTDPRGGVVIANVTVGRTPVGVAYDEANRYVYVANFLSNNTSVISGTSVVATVPVGSGPRGVVYDARNRYVYVANSIYSGVNNISVINGTTVVATIPITRGPVDGAYDSGNGYVYMTVVGGVWVINGTSVLATITSGLGVYSFPNGVDYDSSNGYVYVADYGLNMVHVISGTNVIANITVGASPQGVGYDSGNGYVYVANSASNTVSVINGTTVIATVQVGTQPIGVTRAGSNGYVYITNISSNSVSVISDTTVVDTIPVGIAPWGLAYNSANGYLYVASDPNVGLVPPLGFVNVISTTTDYQLFNSGPVTITAGGTGTATIVTSLTSNPPFPVTLSCSNLPSGIICQNFSVNPVTPTVKGTVSQVTINVTTSVSAGAYNVEVMSKPLGETTTATNIVVTVAPAAKPNAILGLDPGIFYTIIAVVAIAVATSLLYWRTVHRRRESKTPTPR